MKKSTPKIFLLLSIIAIFLTISISQSLNQQKITGTISNIKYNTNRIIITLQQSPDKEIIIFTNNILAINSKLQQGENIEIHYKQTQTYNNKIQIISDKIIKINKKITS